MRTMHSQSFKKQAVEKALSRANGVTHAEVSDELGIGRSTLHRWISDTRNNKLESFSEDGILSSHNKKKEKKPQDWSLDERLEIVMACASLDTEEKNKYCRKQGVYPHHVAQWQHDFASGNSSLEKMASRQAVKNLKNENKALRKELKIRGQNKGSCIFHHTNSFSISSISFCQPPFLISFLIRVSG